MRHWPPARRLNFGDLPAAICGRAGAAAVRAADVTGSDWAGQGRAGQGRVGSGRVGPGRVGSGRGGSPPPPPGPESVSAPSCGGLGGSGDWSGTPLSGGCRVLCRATHPDGTNEIHALSFGRARRGDVERARGQRGIPFLGTASLARVGTFW